MARFLSQIYEQNSWFKDHRNIDSDVHLVRLKKYPFIWHETSFLDHGFSDGVYFVYGMRQVGKTTHLKMFIKNNLNDRNARRRKERHIRVTTVEEGGVVGECRLGLLNRHSQLKPPEPSLERFGILGRPLCRLLGPKRSKTRQCQHHHDYRSHIP